MIRLVEASNHIDVPQRDVFDHFLGLLSEVAVGRAASAIELPSPPNEEREEHGHGHDR